ncbi:hypothetical protein E2R56_29615 [Rhodococcus qingshengii]|nr:hypothetical protein E2R56_29615 [Rhodococcus qingshengii]
MHLDRVLHLADSNTIQIHIQCLQFSFKTSSTASCYLFGGMFRRTTLNNGESSHVGGILQQKHPFVE